MNNSKPAKSGVVFWLLLVVAGLMVGAGIALLARPLPAKYGWMSHAWVGPALAGCGLFGLVAALAGLLRRPARRRPEPKETPVPASLPRKPITSDEILTPIKSMNAREVATFLLQELERCLELLRHTADSDDLDRVGEAITQLREWGAKLSLERERLEVSARKTKQLIKIRLETTQLHREQLHRGGHDLEVAEQTVSTLPPRLGKSELEETLDRCAKRLAHVARQFRERPQIRDGLTGLAQSIGTFLGLRKRTVDPTDPAMAATLKLPDLTALEKLLAQIGELKAKHAQHPPDPAQLETQKTYVRNLLNALAPSDGLEGHTTLNDLTTALQASADALERADLDRHSKG
jgi:hypothetical protein